MRGEPEVHPLEKVTEEEVAAFARLLPQLSAGARPLDLAGLSAVAGAGGNTLLVARQDGGLVGFCLVATFPTPTGVRALLEDVVVDQAATRRGIGSRLVEAAVGAARAAGARTLDLTSRPSREAANRLYERCGFERRETNVWRRELGA